VDSLREEIMTPQPLCQELMLRHSSVQIMVTEVEGHALRTLIVTEVEGVDVMTRITAEGVAVVADSMTEMEEVDLIKVHDMITTEGDLIAGLRNPDLMDHHLPDLIKVLHHQDLIRGHRLLDLTMAHLLPGLIRGLRQGLIKDLLLMEGLTEDRRHHLSSKADGIKDIKDPLHREVT